MANPRRTRFSRRVPDHVTNELVAVLSDKATFGFKDLFIVVYENLKARNAVSGGEEMLRLRAYEKLQNLVTRGLVNKEGKQYTALDNIKDAITEAAPSPAAVTTPASPATPSPAVTPEATK